MRERRKVGVVTLVVACLLVMGWVRSLTVNDQIVLPCKDDQTVYFLDSVNGDIWWAHLNRANESSTFLNWDSIKWNPNRIKPFSEDFENAFHWQFRWLRFGIRKLKPGTLDTATMTFMSLPYWSVVIPMTFISLWLVLSKPRSSTPQNDIEPTANEGT